MAELGKKLGKLSLAILENFVEGTLGKEFVDELRAPTARSLAIESALENSEKRFAKEFSDKAFAEKMFSGVSEKNLGMISEGLDKFFDHPSDSDFQDVLRQIIGESFPDTNASKIKPALNLYINILTEEFALADEKFRENARALSDLRTTEILRRVEILLSQRETSKIESTVLPSLHQLPPAPADFTGRESKIADLLKDFDSHKGATISGLTGMGGIGKTALGLMVAHKIVESYPDAQIFLDLKGTTTPLGKNDIIRHVVLSFEPKANLEGLDEVAMISTYRSILYDKKCLLFLDNASSADQLKYLDPPESGALLVTSRKNFTVPGLNTHQLDTLNETEANKFLIALCKRIGNKASEIAMACGYLPLALRIAGSFLKLNKNWSVDKYLAQLTNKKIRLKTLQESRENAELLNEPDLAATFELSYRQLSNDERIKWCALSVFPGSFSLIEVVPIWEMGEFHVHNMLSRLCRYSLLEFDEKAMRYKLHDLLAEFASTHLSEEERLEVNLRYRNMRRMQKLKSG